MDLNNDFGNGVLWAVATILLAMLFSAALWHDTCYNPGIVIGTALFGLWFKYRARLTKDV